jgi:hypothetical protein
VSEVAGHGQDAHAKIAALSRDIRQTVLVDVQQVKVHPFTR